MKQTIITAFLILILTTINTYAQQSFQKYYKECNVKGSTSIYDYKNKQWFYTDSIDTHIQTLPASTFKILNSLIALETGAIIDENEILKWDGADKTFLGNSMPSWNRDTDLKTAYKNSTIWFYVELANKIGWREYKKYFKKTAYGNGNLTEKGTDFWNYGDFGISPKNQVDFLIKFYENKLPFSDKNTAILKEMMISEHSDLGIFRDKTGWAQKDNQNIGWWVGYLTTKKNVYFFATRIIDDAQNNNKEFSSCRKTITEKILKDIIEK